MLGTSFFHEMTGHGRKTEKTKVDDSSILLAESQDNTGEIDDQVYQSQHDDIDEDETFEALLAEGDQDAPFFFSRRRLASSPVADLSQPYSRTRGDSNPPQQSVSRS